MSKVFNEKCDWSKDANLKARELCTEFLPKIESLVEEGYTLTDAYFLLVSSIEEARMFYSLETKDGTKWLSRE